MTAKDSEIIARSTPFAKTDVIILAGGLGTRLGSVFPDRPKVLAPLAGRPILDHQLERLRQQGAHRVILALGHLADQVCDHVESGFDGLDLIISIEPEQLGTAGAIAQALPLIRSTPIIVINGDSLIDTDLTAFVSWAMTKTTGSALVATAVEQADRYGVLRLGDHDIVEAVDEKPTGCGRAWINAGVYWLNSVALGRIASVSRGSLERDILPQLPAGHLHAYRSSERFIDIGTPESLARAALWQSEATKSDRNIRA